MAIEERIILTADASSATKNVNNLSKGLDKLEKSLDEVTNTAKGLDLSNLNEASKTIELLSNSLSKDIPQTINRISTSFAKLNTSLGDFNSARFDDIRISISGLADHISTIQGLGEALNLLNKNLKESKTSANETNVEIKQSADNIDSFTVSVNNATKAQDSQLKTVKSLRDNLKFYRDAVLNAEEGTKEYETALENLTETQQQLNSIQNITINGAGNIAQIFTNTARVGTNLAKTFGIAQGALALFGSESEELNKTAVKLLATLNLINGLSGLGSFPKNLEALRTSLKNSRIAVLEFNASLLANPIVAVVASVALLAAGLVVLYNNLDSTNRNLKESKKLYDDNKTSLEAFNNEIDYNTEKLKAQGKAQSEINKFRLEQTDELIKRQRTLIDEITKRQDEEIKKGAIFNKKRIEQIRELRREAVKELTGYQNDRTKIYNQIQLDEIKEDTETKKKLQAQADTAAKKADDARKKELEDLKKYLNDVSGATDGQYEVQFNKLTSEYEKRKALLTKYNKDTLDLDYQYQQDVIKLQQDRTDREVKILQDRLKTESDLYDIQSAENIQSAQNDIQQSVLNVEKLYLELTEIRSQYGNENDILERINMAEAEIAEKTAILELQEIERLEALRMRLTEVLEIEVLNSQQRINVEAELQDTINEIERRSVDYRIGQIKRENDARQDQVNLERKIKDEREGLQNSYVDAALKGANAVSDILGRATVAGKAIAVAGATVDTYRGVAQSLAQPGLPFLLRIANASATGATGLAAVKNILSTNIGSTSSAPSLNTSVTAPSIDYTNPTPDVSNYYDPVQNEAVRQLESTEERGINTRVYVTESDIRNSLDYNRVRVEEATF